jgi:hypothetical protein
VLDVNEHFPDGLLSAGYDGMIYLWDIRSGRQVHAWSFTGYQFLDGEVAPGGQFMTFSDMQGRYTLLGIKQFMDRYTVAPGEQFFLTDYQPLVRDLNEFVVDATTQVRRVNPRLHETSKCSSGCFSRLCLIYSLDNHYVTSMEHNTAVNLPLALVSPIPDSFLLALI